MSEAKGDVVLSGVDMRFGNLSALQGIDLHINAGEIACVLGPSGCGKSTLLSIVAGFVSPTNGAVSVDGELVRGPSPSRGVCFQEPALFPWLSVWENVLFGPKAQGRCGRIVRDRAALLLDIVGLTRFRRHKPAQLSGGMKQRVAIARLLVNEPRLLLMDEPFGALDALTRVQMQDFLMHVHQEFRSSVMFITHDVEEAIYIGDRVIVMSQQPGRIVFESKIDEPRPRSREFLLSESLNSYKAKATKYLWFPAGETLEAAGAVDAAQKR